jgi:hypothetical protein
MFPNFDRTTWIARLPNTVQTCMSKTNDAEEVMEEMRQGAPAEVCVYLRVFVPLEDPMGWHLWNLRISGFLRLVGAETFTRLEVDGSI